MAFPLLLLSAGLVGGLWLTDQYKTQLKLQDHRRVNDLDADDDLGRAPSELLPSPHQHRLVPGAIVCCEVYHEFIHTGIVIDDHTIVELHGSGLIRAVSMARFLSKRSGGTIFIACNKSGEALRFEQGAKRAVSDIFCYVDYQLHQNNCYRHTWRCISGQDQPIKSFKAFNNKLSQLVSHGLYWDVVEHS